MLNKDLFNYFFLELIFNNISLIYIEIVCIHSNWIMVYCVINQ